MGESLEVLVTKAKLGNKKALEAVVIEIKDMVYNLSLKMLFSHDDASDATQEILIKVITHLSTFKAKSQFKTWVYRVATNHLLNSKGKKSKELEMTFEDYAQFVDIGNSNEVNHSQNEGEIALLEEDIRIRCTLGLLKCLNEPDRLVYILGAVMNFNSVDAAEILAITPENFRKKLSRSKTKIKNFMSNKCGVVNPNNPCRCKKKIDFAIDNKMVKPEHLLYADISNRKFDLSDKFDSLQRTIAVYQSTPSYASPEFLLEEIKQVVGFN